MLNRLSIRQQAIWHFGGTMLPLGFLCVGLVTLAEYRPIWAAAALYCLFFLVIAWYSPVLALIVVFGASPFQADVSNGLGARFSIAELNLALMAPVFLIQNLKLKRPMHLDILTAPILTYLVVCGFSCFVVWREHSAIVSVWQMVLYWVIGTIVIGGCLKDPVFLIVPLRAFLMSSSILAIMVITTGSLSVLGLSKNGVGSTFAGAVIICLELLLVAKHRREQWLYGTLFVVLFAGLVLTLSRGSWLGCAVGILALLALRRNFKLIRGLVLVMIPIVAICWTLLPQEKRDYALDVRSTSYNINARYEFIDLARQEFESSPLVGTGVGLRKDMDATNILWTCLAETGVLGLAAFLWIHVALMVKMWKAYPSAARSEGLGTLIAIGTGLLLSAFVHGLVDHYWSRGVILVTWGSVAMALAARRETRRLAAMQPQSSQAVSGQSA